MVKHQWNAVRTGIIHFNGMSKYQVSQTFHYCPVC